MENKFKFKTCDLEVEFSGEKTFVENQIIEWKSYLINNSIKTPIALPEKQESQPKEIKVVKQINLEEFFKLKSPETPEDKVISTIYYLEKYEKYQAITELDIYKLLNIEDINKYLMLNLEKGFLTSFGKASFNEYTLTYSGELYVREGLQF